MMYIRRKYVARLVLFALVAVIADPTSEAFLVPSPKIHNHGAAPPASRLYLKRGGTKKKKAKDGTVCVNRSARRNYEIVDTLEAGIALKGTEVKSVRDGKMNIGDGYVRPTKNGRTCILYNVHISKHSMTNEYDQHEERRPRTLLVHKEEARKFLQQTERSGMTIVPLKAYFNEQNRLKIQIAVCRGKNVRDKRQAIKDREANREANRMIKNFRL